jgi:hypothetical protein
MFCAVFCHFCVIILATFDKILGRPRNAQNALDFDNEQLWVSRPNEIGRLLPAYTIATFHASVRLCQLPGGSSAGHRRPGTFLSKFRRVHRAFRVAAQRQFCGLAFRIAHNLLNDRYRQPRYLSRIIPLKTVAPNYAP